MVRGGVHLEGARPEEQSEGACVHHGTGCEY